VAKPVILLFTTSYLPGYKAGGILRTIVNTVDHLNRYYDFKIVTLDRDLGDEEAYSDIETETWQKVGNAYVYYLGKGIGLAGRVKELIRTTAFDVIHLNSFFDPVFTIKIIRLHWLRSFNKRQIILAPRGELNNTQLKFKWHKKYIYILFFRIFKLDSRIIYHASDRQEANDISTALGIPFSRIRMAQDLPKLINMEVKADNYNPQNELLKVLFLSRISKEKNLKYAIEVLQKIREHICFDIYGPVEDAGYWQECRNAISQLPENISVRYCGIVHPEKVDEIMQEYDLFFLPTFAENFGHAIAEALANGLPVLISSNTPWTGLTGKGLGWDIDLNNEQAFVNVMEQFSKTNREQRIKDRRKRKMDFLSQVSLPDIIKENIELYK